jgi:hypothetical protein
MTPRRLRIGTGRDTFQQELWVWRQIKQKRAVSVKKTKVCIAKI